LSRAQLIDSEVCLLSLAAPVRMLTVRLYRIFRNHVWRSIAAEVRLLLEFVTTKACDKHLRSIAISIIGSQSAPREKPRGSASYSYLKYCLG